MLTEIYQQAAKKTDAQPGYQHRFLRFMVQHHRTRITKIMQDLGLSGREIKDVYDIFDEKTPKHFDRPNLRNLTEMTEMERHQQLERLRPPPVHHIQHDGYCDIKEENKKDDKDEDYDTSQRSAKTTASASGSNIAQYAEIERNWKSQDRQTGRTLRHKSLQCEGYELQRSRRSFTAENFGQPYNDSRHKAL
eukprot:5851649-Amphidinium_carterae.1